MVKANKIRVNVSKSKYIIFSFRKQFLLPNIQHGAENIEITDGVKFLGIVLDEKLNLKNLVGLISSKNSKSIGIFYRLNAFVPTEVLKMQYYSLVHPYLNFCVNSWYGASQTLSNSVFFLQNNSVRAIYFGLRIIVTLLKFFKQNSIPKNL